jgi:parvulin-like peptidyl-prolyl isomerase
MNRKVYRVAAVPILFVFVVTLTGSSQQSGSNPTTPASGQRAVGPPPSPGTTPPPADTATSNKIVLKVGTQSVTQGDMDFLIRSLDPQTRRALAQQGLRALVDRYVLTLVLAQEAVSRHLDENPDFRRQLAAQRDRMLAQAEYQNLAQQVKVTPEEISQYYAAHGADFDEIKARQIVVRTKPPNAKEGTPGLTLEEGRARIEEIRKALASGADPKQVAKDFGIPNQVLVEAEPRTIRQSASLPDPQKEAFNLKNGEFTAVQEVGSTLALFQVVSRGRVELKDASQEIENTLRQQKLDAEIAELKNKSNVWIDEAYFRVASAPAAPRASPTEPQGNPPAKP